MHFCRRCGIEIVSEFSKTKLCKTCIKAMEYKSLDDNKKLIQAAKRAKDLGITYGEYSLLRRIIKDIESKIKC